MSSESVEKLIEAAKKKVPDPDAISDGYDMTFQWIGKKLCKIMGYKESELLDRQVTNVHSDSQEHARKMESEIFTLSEPTIKTVPVKTKQGKLIKLKMKFFPFKVDGNPYMTAKVLEVTDG